MLAVTKDPARVGVMLRHIEMPRLAAGDALIRVHAAGICGSDQRIYRSVGTGRPFVIGHELAGEIVQLGDSSRERFRLGDRVAVSICIGCGDCRDCHSGRVNICKTVHEIGITRNGGMAEFAAIPVGNLFVLPDSMEYVTASLADPLACVIHSMTRTVVVPDEWVAVVGPGPLGLIATQYLTKRCGSRVVMVGTRYDRLRVATELGAAQVYDIKAPHVFDAIQARTGGGAAIVYEASGTDSGLSCALRLVRRGGAVILLTVHHEVYLNLESTIRGDVSLIGSICYNHDEFRSALALLETGRVDVSPLTHNLFALTDAERAFASVMSRECLKAIVTH